MEEAWISDIMEHHTRRMGNEGILFSKLKRESIKGREGGGEIERKERAIRKCKFPKVSEL